MIQAGVSACHKAVVDARVEAVADVTAKVEA